MKCFIALLSATSLHPFQNRGLNDMELDPSSMEKRFAFKFLKKILKYVDSAQEFIAHLGKLQILFLESLGLLKFKYLIDRFTVLVINILLHLRNLNNVLIYRINS